MFLGYDSPKSYGKNAKSSMKTEWQSVQEPLTRQQGLNVRLLLAERPLSFADVLAGWHTDGAFRTFFLGTLKAAATPAFFWEMPPITRTTLHRPYEFVVVDSPHLATVRADSRPFAGQFRLGRSWLWLFVIWVGMRLWLCRGR